MRTIYMRRAGFDGNVTISSAITQLFLTPLLATGFLGVNGDAQTVANLTNTTPLTLGTGAASNVLLVTGNITGPNPSFTGTVNNSSTITLNPSGTLQLGRMGVAPVNITLTGGGAVTLAGGTLTGVIRRVVTLQGLQTVGQTGLTNVDNTISGFGTIKTLGLTNQATINANSAGETLTLSPTRITNSGTLQAGLGGTLSIVGKDTSPLNLTNSPRAGGVGGSIFSGQGGTVQLNNVAVAGGFLDTTGTGEIDGAGPVSLSNLTVNGAYKVGAGTTTTIGGTVRNNGRISVPALGTLNGSNLINGNKVSAAKGSTVTLNSFTQTDGSLLADGSMQTPLADIEGGIVTGTGMMTGTLAMGGTFQPGDNSAPGIFTIVGQYNQTVAGSLSDLLGGTLPGEFGQTLITGSSILAGVLDVSLFGGFQPSTSDVFPILESTSGFSGFFANAVPSAPGLPGLVQYSGGTFDVNYNVSYDGELAVTLSNFSPGSTTTGATPEPPSSLLFGSALIGLALVIRWGRSVSARSSGAPCLATRRGIGLGFLQAS